MTLHGAAKEPNGLASWYGDEVRGVLMANGEPFDPERFTCAHRTLPFGTRLLVTSLRTHKTVVVTVTDRGPAARLGRVLDLSRVAFKCIDDLGAGITPVKFEAAGWLNKKIK